MAYQPIVAGTGLVAWNFLQRTMDTQIAAFQESPEISRDVDYFTENIGKIENAEDLVADRRLLTVALGAFGLDADIDSAFFIKTILAEGSQADDSLANKMADSRYVEFAEAFGFGDIGGPWHKSENFAAKMTEAHTTRQFEIAVGEQNESLRFAMNAARSLEEISVNASSDNTKWFSILGSAPLRSVMETTFNLPTSFGALDLDKQLEVFRGRMTKLTGDGEISQFVSSEARDTLVQRYLMMDQISEITTYSSQEIALTLLSY